MEIDRWTRLCADAYLRLPKMTLTEKCNLIDELDPYWYADFCDREGTEEELTAYLYDLLKVN
jgi:hypothetical protein